MRSLAGIANGTDSGSGSAVNVGFKEGGLAKMEGLPYAFGRFGYLGGSRLYSLASYGYYWSGSTVSSSGAFYLDYSDSALYPSYQVNRDRGWSVRCVAR